MRVWLVVLLCTAVAYAEPPITPAVKRAAAAHHKQAKAYAAKHQLDDAIRELELSIEQVADPDVLFELAQLYDQKPDEDKAFATYQRITEGKHVPDAQARVAAITAGRAQREADAKARAEAEAKARAEEEARRAAEAAAEAERKADEQRRQSEQADRERRSAEADVFEAEIRKHAVERQRDSEAGAARVSWELDHEKRHHRHALGVHYLKLGLACGAVAGVATAVGAIMNMSVENGGFATASDISSAIAVGRVSNVFAWGFGAPAAVSIVVALPLLVLGHDRGQFRVSAVATDSMQGLSLSGAWP